MNKTISEHFFDEAVYYSVKHQEFYQVLFLSTQLPNLHLLEFEKCSIIFF